MAILEEILRRTWKASFTAMGLSPKGLDKEFLALMWRAGFRSFWISPESASETMINNYRKSFTLDDLVGAAQATNRTAFAVMWCFLIGGPGETNQTLQESLDFTLRFLRHKHNPPYYLANFFVGIRLYPGTDLWATALEQGLLKEKLGPAGAAMVHI